MFRAWRDGRGSEPACGLEREVRGECRHVAEPLAKRRESDGEDGDAIPQVLSEAAIGDHCLEVSVRRGDDPYVRVELALSPDTFECAVLKDAEEADLCRGREFADLVEEECSSVRALEPSESLRFGTGETAPLVAEEFGIDEFGRDGPAVDAEEWLCCSSRAVVDGACDDFLAGSGFSEQEDGNIGSGDLVDAFHDIAEAGLGTDDRV